MVDRVQAWVREAEAVRMQAVSDPLRAAESVAHVRASFVSALAAAPSDPVLRGIDARLRYAEGIIATHQGQLESAQTTFHSLLEEYERLGEPLRVAECLNALAVVADRQGEVEGGVGFLERCFQIRSEHDSPLRGQVRVLCNIGVFQARMNDHDAALATYRFAEERLDGHHPELLGLILTSRALLYRSLGRMEQVHGLLTEATALLEPFGPGPLLLNSLLELATEEIRLGLLGEAAAHLSVADSMVETIGMVIFVPEARLVAAQIHLKNGEHAQADAVLEEGLSVATDEQRVRLLSLRATGAEAAGDLRAALRWTREAHSVEVQLLKARSEAQVARARARLPGVLYNEQSTWLQNQLERVQAEARGLQQRLEHQRMALASAAHDLHNPLSVVLLLGELANSEPESLEASARDIVDAARHMQSLVARLLETNRPSAESAIVVNTSTRLPPLVEGAIHRCAPLAEAKSHELRVDLPPDLPEVEGDAGALARVLDNLLSNAIKYTPAGGMIHLQAERTGSDVSIAVLDSGPGLSPSDLDRVFLFPQPLSAKPTNGEPQHGLGLVNVRRLVRKMGGRVRAENHPDGGARFSVMLRTTG